MSGRLRVRVLRVGGCRHPEAIARRGAPFWSAEFPALVGLLEHRSRGAFLFDTGYAARFRAATRTLPGCLYRWATPMELPEREELPRQLAGLGLAPADVRGVLASHFHADHIAGLADFPGARLHCARAALDRTRTLGSWSGVLRGILPELLPADLEARCVDMAEVPLRALPGPWSVLGEGHDLFADGSALAVPLSGHAPGHFGLLVRDESGAELFFAADAAWSRRALVEQRLPAFVVRWIVDDWTSYARTFERLSGLVRTHPELLVLPSHCGESWRALPAELRVEA